MALAGNLIGRGSHDYVFRSQWHADQLPDAITDGAELHVIPKVSNYLKEFARSAVTGGRAYPSERYDLVLNLDALGMASGGRRRMTIIHDIYYATTPDTIGKVQWMKQQSIHASMVARSSVIVGISEATSAEVRKHFPRAADRVRTILSDSTMNDVLPGDLPPRLEPNGYVLAVANVTPNKNFGVLARAFARMCGDFPDLRLVHVGGDADELFAGILAEKGMQDRLIRLRGISDQQLAAVYANAAALVVPSIVEGFCLPIVEAQRLDCPVVFSNRSACGEIGGSGGISFDPLDEDALEMHLRGVVGDPALRDALRGMGRANAARFSWDRTTSLYEAAILDTINREK